MLDVRSKMTRRRNTAILIAVGLAAVSCSRPDDEGLRREIAKTLTKIDASYAARIEKSEDAQSMADELEKILAEDERKMAEAVSEWERTRDRIATTDPGSAFIDYGGTLKEMADQQAALKKDMELIQKNLQILMEENTALKAELGAR